MQTGGPWVEPPDATVVMETGFAGRIAYPETGVTYTTQEMNLCGYSWLQTLEVTLRYPGALTSDSMVSGWGVKAYPIRGNYRNCAIFLRLFALIN